ncbi:MAG: lamin tail domain-containing protein [Saprospiraceae bacterium]
MNKPIYYLALLFFGCFPFTDLQTQIIINEIYADVAVGLIGDANGDGIRNAKEDEFIELFNPDSLAIDLSGHQLMIDQAVKHEFAEGTLLPPKTFLVVFGGGTPNGLFGGSPVLLASSGNLGLSNNGTSILLQSNAGLLLDSLTYQENDIDASLVRTPEFLGNFIPHTERPDAFGLPYSPGTLTNSFPFNNGDTTLIHFTINRGIAIESDGQIDLFLNLINPKPAQVVVTVALTGGTGDSMDIGNFTTQNIIFPVNSNSQRLLNIPITNDVEIEGQETFIFTITNVNAPDNNQISINQSFELTIFDDDNDFGLILTEFLADPPNGLIGDANGDGERNASQDEFLEFLNNTDEAIDLSGMAIYDADLLRHQIPDGTILQPNQLFVVFGGGEVHQNFDNTIVQKASSNRLSLANIGDRILLRDSLQNILLLHDYGEEANDNQSIVFCPIEKDANVMKHTAIGEGLPLSPGILHNCIPFTVGLAEVKDFDIKVYPNPVTDKLTIELLGEMALSGNLSLVNTQGQTVMSTPSTFFAIPNLPKGLYFLKVNTNKGLIIKKILIQ